MNVKFAVGIIFFTVALSGAKATTHSVITFNGAPAASFTSSEFHKISNDPQDVHNFYDFNGIYSASENHPTFVSAFTNSLHPSITPGILSSVRVHEAGTALPITPDLISTSVPKIVQRSTTTATAKRPSSQSSQVRHQDIILQHADQVIQQSLRQEHQPNPKQTSHLQLDLLQQPRHQTLLQHREQQKHGSNSQRFNGPQFTTTDVQRLQQDENAFKTLDEINDPSIVFDLVKESKSNTNSCSAGFSVRKGLVQPNEKTNSGRVYFQDVLTNVGGWIPDLQQFEAPCDGLYYFSFHAISTQDQDFTMALMKDGKYQVTAYGGKDGYQWGSNSALLFLKAGESVFLELQQGDIYEHPFEEAYTSFSGFRVMQ